MTDPMAQATMLVRRPVAEVFDAFVNPDKITKFWLDATTGLCQSRPRRSALAQ